MSEPADLAALERLRAAWRAAPARAEGGCPEPEQIWRAALGELPPEDAGALVDHAIGCSACDRAFQLALELRRTPAAGAPAGAAAADARTAAGARRSRLPRALAALGALAAVVALAVPMLRTRPPAPSLRARDELTIRAAPGLSRLPRDRFVLRWSPAPGARYTLQVVTRDLRPIYSRSGLEAPEHQVPAAALSALPAGAEVLWRVEAVRPDGERLSSPPFAAQVE